MEDYLDSKKYYVAESTKSVQQFPTAYNVTYKSTWRKLCCWRGIDLELRASSTSGPPILSLSLPKSVYGDLILHSGSQSSTPLAQARSKCRWKSCTYTIALPGSHLATACTLTSKGRRWWFDIPINGRIERFEWRHSSSSEVRSLGASRWGFKLVRLGNFSESDSSSDRSSNDESRHGTYSSDGLEVVAVWAGGSWKSMSQVGDFQLCGSGATGELGGEWSLMALMTCMCIWQKEMRDSYTAGASASSSSASSATVAAAVS